MYVVCCTQTAILDAPHENHGTNRPKAKSSEEAGGHLQPHVSKEKEKEKEKEKAKPKKKEEKIYRPGPKVLLGELRAEAFVIMHFTLVIGNIWRLPGTVQ